MKGILTLENALSPMLLLGSNIIVSIKHTRHAFQKSNNSKPSKVLSKRQSTPIGKQTEAACGGGGNNDNSNRIKQPLLKKKTGGSTNLTPSRIQMQSVVKKNMVPELGKGNKEGKGA